MNCPLLLTKNALILLPLQKLGSMKILSTQCVIRQVTLTGYSVIRRDRTNGAGGGVLLYIRHGLFFRRLDNLLDRSRDFEILFVSVRPHTLPRPLSIVIVAVVYCPPWYNADICRELSDFIADSFDRLSSHFSDAAFIITGDFNHLNCNQFSKHLCLKQMVNKPTRGNNILDKVFTNISMYYAEPAILPPIGKSDHNCIFIHSKPNIIDTGQELLGLFYGAVSARPVLTK